MSTTNVKYNGKEAAENLFRSTRVITNKKFLRPQVIRYTGPTRELVKGYIRWL